MIFPTYWKGEGFPGVLVDAFVAGLPVIASDWNMNTEVIRHNQNGLVIPPKDSEALAYAMRYLIESKDSLRKMSEMSSANAHNYHIDSLWPKIQDIIST